MKRGRKEKEKRKREREREKKKGNKKKQAAALGAVVCCVSADTEKCDMGDQGSGRDVSLMVS